MHLPLKHYIAQLSFSINSTHIFFVGFILISLHTQWRAEEPTFPKGACSRSCYGHTASSSRTLSSAASKPHQYLLIFEVNCKYISASDKALGSSQQHQLRVEMLRYQISQKWLWSQDLPRVVRGAGHPRGATSKGPKGLVQRSPQGPYLAWKMLSLMEIFSHLSLDVLPGDFIQPRDMS